MPLDLESTLNIREGKAPAEPRETLDIKSPNGSAVASPSRNRVPSPLDFIDAGIALRFSRHWKSAQMSTSSLRTTEKLTAFCLWLSQDLDERLSEGMGMSAEGLLGWIQQLVSSETVAESDRGSANMQKELRQSLRSCEQTFMEGARECAQVCPGELAAGPEAFSDLMMDMYRGLMVKVLVEIARADRKWQKEECTAAMILLRHVWGAGLEQERTERAIRKSIELADSLAWDSLLGLFRKHAPLHELQSTLVGQIMRIANLIAKANDEVTESETNALRKLHGNIEMVFASRSGRKAEKPSLGDPFSQAAAVAAERKKPPATSSKPASGPASGKAVAAAAAQQPARTPRKAQQRVSAGLARGMPKLAADAGEPTADDRLREAMRELDSLVGMESVRKDVNELIAFLKVQAERTKRGLPKTPISLHTVFEGNPGTGKTTVARILGKALGGLGIVAKGHVVETDRSGLVAKFAGQTGPLVNDKVDSALDGVLFVDEAYSLASESGEDQFGDEAIQVLLKRMEDDRQRLIVILAGYPAPMREMLKTNPGLSSRFQRTVFFPDYSVEELVQVFDGLCRQHHYVLSGEAREKLTAEFYRRVLQKDEHFGNARMVRNCFEAAIRRMASRIIGIVPLTESNLTTLTSEDLDF